MKHLFFALLLTIGILYLWLNYHAEKPPTLSPNTLPKLQSIDTYTQVPMPSINGSEFAANTKQRCFSLGPFADQTSISRAVSYFSSQNISTRQRVGKVKNYRVFIPSPPNDKDREALIDVLEKKDIRDHYLTQSDHADTIISLGYFKSGDNANRYADSIRKKGIGAKVAESERDTSLYWLDYDDSHQAMTLDSLRTRLDAPELETNRIDCGVGQ